MHRGSWLWLALALELAAGPASAERSLSVPPAGRQDFSQLAARVQARPSAPRVPRVVERPAAPQPRELGGAAATARAPAAATGATGGMGGDRSPIIVSFPALGDDNSSIPPDTMGAAGPSHLMVMLNTQVRIQARGGDNLQTVTLDDFWTNGTGLTGSPFDPRLLYDPMEERWIATVDANPRSTGSKAWFAISDNADPTGGWTFYAFDADATNISWADFPGFGFNHLWYAITNNMFTIGGDVFSGAKMWVIDKSSVLSGGAATVTVFDTGFDAAGCCDGFALQPVITNDLGEPTLYILDNGFWTSSGTPLLRMSEITGSAASPSWAATAGSPFTGAGLFPVDTDFANIQIEAAQAGTSSRIDTADARIASNAIQRNGFLWATHSGGHPASGADRTNVYWYQLDPDAMIASGAPIVQSGVVDGGLDVHLFFPSIAVNRFDGACLGFSRSDSSRFAEAVVACRSASRTQGQLGAIQVLKAGEDAYVKTFSGSRIRWGDYSATVVDPRDDISFWTIQEYAAQDVGPTPSNDRWGTQWGLLRSEPALPSAGPGVLAAAAIALLAAGVAVLAGRAGRSR